MIKKKKLFYILFLLTLFFGVLNFKALFYSPFNIKNEKFVFGVYHVHSKNSDGAGNLREISLEAKRSGISFVILTDHGKPNRLSSFRRKLVNGVLFVGGSEIDTTAGHLTAFGFSFKEDYKFSPFPEQTIKDIKEEGGKAVLAYPEDPKYRWRYWGDDFSPFFIEIINLTTYLRRLKKQPFKGLNLILNFLINRYSILKAFSAPSYSLEKWDELLMKGNRVLPLFAIDSHGRTPLWDNKIVKFPSYSDYFKLLNIAIRKGEDVLEALEKGHYFLVIRGAGVPEDFEFLKLAKNSKNDKGNPAAKSSKSVFFKLHFEPFKTKKVLIVNGIRVFETYEDKIVYEVRNSGYARVEVYILGHPLLRDDVPWIITPPVFFGDLKKGFKLKEKGSEYKEEFPINLREFRVEKDSYSKADFWINDNGTGIFKFFLKKPSKAIKDLWCAIALRKKINLRGYRGIGIEGKAGSILRFWIQLRSGKRWYFYSVKFKKTFMKHFIPFEKFYYYFKRREKPPEDIDSIIISFDNSTVSGGKAYKVKIKKVFFYR